MASIVGSVYQFICLYTPHLSIYQCVITCVLLLNVKNWISNLYDYPRDNYCYSTYSTIITQLFLVPLQL